MCLNLEGNDNGQIFNLKIYFTGENNREYYGNILKLCNQNIKNIYFITYFYWIMLTIFDYWRISTQI